MRPDPLTYLSVCDGIGAAHLAFSEQGWVCAGMSEIDESARAVLKWHYPGVPLHGDFRKLIADPPDVGALCGGTPCQAFSVAGKRESMADERGNLTLQFVLLANAIDALRRFAGKPGIWIMWENVPGVLSTSDNAFGCFLGALCGSGAAIHAPKERSWPNAGVVDGPIRSAAWRVFDAQHFGLAQRRKRVFLLARAGTGAFTCADALLPLIQCRAWHPAPGRTQGQGTPIATAPSLTASGRGVSRTGESRGQDPLVPVDLDPVLAPTLLNNGMAAGSATQQDAQNGALIVHTLRGDGFDASEDGTGRGTPLIAATLSAQPPSRRNGGSHPTPGHLVMSTGQANSEIVNDGEPSLTCNHEPPILLRMREGCAGGGKGPLLSEDQSLTLATANDQVLALPSSRRQGAIGADPAIRDLAEERSSERDTPIAFALRGRDEGAQPEVSTDGKVSALRAADGGSTRDMVDIAFQGNASHTNSMNPGPVAPTLDKGKTDGMAVAFTVHSDNSCAMRGNGDAQVAIETELARALDTTGGYAGKQGGNVVMEPAAFDLEQITSKANMTRVDPQLPAPTMSTNGSMHMATETHVRRLTPRECERLQGFPDDYTLVPVRWYLFPHTETKAQFRRGQYRYRYVEKSEPMADGPRYKMLGNSWAVPCAAYVGAQVQRCIQSLM